MIVRRIYDHKRCGTSIMSLNSNISYFDICMAQNDLYVLDNGAGIYSAVVMGYRESYEDNIPHVVKDTENVKKKDFRITFFESNGYWSPNEVMLTNLLIEFLADKNDCPVRYTPTGRETEEMINALNNTGFMLQEDGEYTRFAITPTTKLRY